MTRRTTPTEQSPPSSGRRLDSFDRAILRIVQQDARTPQRRIAEAVNLSAAAVQRRIAAMEAAGVIVRNVALVDPEALGQGITSIVQVNLRDERAPTVDAAKALFRARPEVQQCYYVTGGVSFVLVIVTSDMRAYEALTRELFAENDCIASYGSLIALDRVKVDTGIVIPPPG
ncbi:Lrp/AsnC family transcriptional regulator [Novosphingobium sp. PhB165]|uniref:Lrp/AsnC family transcriptional regulator n=1 Tax=Novosphingobium sp. PhB165 TaxID=2485105 RepID=UPI00104BAF85|nr:Lrp/AsnC family transcriptional regulator [Novosphingobium sp. PhB165]